MLCNKITRYCYASVQLRNIISTVAISGFFIFVIILSIIYTIMKKTYFHLSLLLCCTNIFAQSNVRLKEDFDFDWKFILADESGYAVQNYNDSEWSDIQLPHDWNITQDFDRNARGAGSVAYLPEGIGWYRKNFKVPVSYQGKKVSILFEGIFHQSNVYINGKHLGFRPYGYCSIEYDLTPYLNVGGNNTIAVRVDCTGDRARWYSGAGIYRHAWLQITNPIQIETYRTYITTPLVSEEKADIEIVTTISNSESKEQNIIVSQRVLDSTGKQVAKSENNKIFINAGEKTI